MTQFGRSRTTSYQSAIVNVALSCCNVLTYLTLRNTVEI